MLPARDCHDIEDERDYAVCATKRLGNMLEVGLCDAVVLRFFTDTMRDRPGLLLERHKGLVGWTVFLLNRKDHTDEARAVGLAALRYFLDRTPDGEDVATWTDTVCTLLKANGEDVSPETARTLALETDRKVPGTHSPS